LIHTPYHAKDIDGDSRAVSPNKGHSERRVAFAGILKLRHDPQGFVIGAKEKLEIMVPGLEGGAQSFGFQQRERLVPFAYSKFLQVFFYY
jgi:hypothetical protein